LPQLSADGGWAFFSLLIAERSPCPEVPDSRLSLSVIKVTPAACLRRLNAVFGIKPQTALGAFNLIPTQALDVAPKETILFQLHE